jgi:endoglucanase
METAWYNPVTTKANITAIKNAGFNAIRIPVSWNKAANSNYNIRADWMARVVDVVNYAVDNDLSIILNTHHDERIFKFTNAEKAESLKAFGKIWEQIADTFRNYDEKLIFEALNEPRNTGSNDEWNGGTEDERNNLNEHYQVFVDTVRASGGNNGGRILIVNPYATSFLDAAINGLKIPADSAADKIIVSFHSYDPMTFCFSAESLTWTQSISTWNKDNASDTGDIHRLIDSVYNKFVQNGIPVIIGEFGAAHKNNEQARADHHEYFVAYAKSKGIKCFLWDDGGGVSIFDRSKNQFLYPKIVDAIMRGAK